jgi:hypothetical protein
VDIEAATVLLTFIRAAQMQSLADTASRSLMIKELTLRTRGQKEVEKLLKRRRRHAAKKNSKA